MRKSLSVGGIRAFLKTKICRFGKNEGASITVEMAFILPIFAAMAFLTFDAGTVYTQYKRGSRHYYAMGDILSAQTTDLTCSRLDTISEMVYDSYAAGNWARRPEKGSGISFDSSGALDFRFVIRYVKVVRRPNGSLRGEIQWIYFRTPNDMDTPGEKKPGELVNVPNGLRIEGLEYIHVNGRLFIAPAINYLGVFDYAPNNQNQTHKQMPINRYFPLRFVPALNLVEDATNGDEFTEKCWDQSPYIKP
ncbi:MAG: TadE/TadG family type IV pilus assembly protein [Pseudomonadota bacterium]